MRSCLAELWKLMIKALFSKKPLEALVLASCFECGDWRFTSYTDTILWLWKALPLALLPTIINLLIIKIYITTLGCQSRLDPNRPLDVYSEYYLGLSIWLRSYISLSTSASSMRRSGTNQINATRINRPWEIHWAQNDMAIAIMYRAGDSLPFKSLPTAFLIGNLFLGRQWWDVAI